MIDARFFSPPTDLAPCFTTFYRLEVDLPEGEEVEDWLHPEWANLRFFAHTAPRAQVLGGEWLEHARFQATGPSSHLTHFALGRTRMWGIGLFPMGWARFVGTPASEEVNKLVDGERVEPFTRFAPLADLLCDPAGEDEAQFQIIIAFFRGLADPPHDEARIRAIHEAMVDPYLLEVSDFARRTGLNQRTLERLCLKHFGFPPRLLLRRQRMMRSLTAFMLAEEGRSWSETIDRHYHDQAHFVHEFHNFMGMSPSEYAAASHPILDAFMRERQRVWGSPAQTLDKPR